VRLRNSYDTGAMAPEPLGQRIKKERLALGMTQRDLADAVGITVPYMSKIEAGKETPTEEKIVKVAEVLGLNPDELILAAGRMPTDVMDRLAADPTKGLEFLRKIRK
jgi:transcriptional regulator with XRE-family HTH domain